MSRRLLLVIIALGLSACDGAVPEQPPEGDPIPDASVAPEVPLDSGVVADAGAPAVVPDAGFAPQAPDAGAVADAAAISDATIDPFEPRPDLTEGLVNVSADLNAVLENGALTTACADYEADPSNRRKKLLCGKAMFFFEGFDTVGVPKDIFDFFGSRFEDVIGIGYSRYGLVPNPNSNNGRPLGATSGAPIGDGIQTIAFGCAMCHFGRLPDGRYAVGAPNHNYDYGAHMLALMLLPGSASPSFDPSQHHPDAIAKIQPAMDLLANSSALRLELLINLLPLLSLSGAPTLSPEYEGNYAHWRTGTMDFAMPPLPLDDGVHTVSKIIDLWEIPSPEERQDKSMPSAFLAWTGGAPSLFDFLDGFVAVGGGDRSAWPASRLEPLYEYLLSLRSPNNPTPPDAASVLRGKDLFATVGCLGCHDGPRGSGRRLFTYEEIGTDDAMKHWADPDLSGTYCCGFDDGSGTPATHAIKSPRLTGLWAKTRFLHNGSLDSLEQLLCLDARPQIAEAPYGTQGHGFGCELTEEDRRDLIAYLRSH